MVAARRLRKSMLKNAGDIDISSVGNIDLSKRSSKNKYIDEDIFIKDNLGTFEEDKKTKLNLKGKLIVKLFISILIIFTCLVGKLLFPEQIKNNQYGRMLIDQYKKDFSKIGCIEKGEDIVNSSYNKIKYIIPENFANIVREKYITSIKPKLVGFEAQSVFNTLFINNNSKTESNPVPEAVIPNTEKDELNTGMGGGEPIIQEKNDETKEEASSVSTMQDDVGLIIEKNIEIKKPTPGTITSKYGAREQIFEGVNSYHTGIDIANKLGTQINSATIGKVIKTEENNKYYGNNVEVETNGVIFKYAHLQSINVATGDNVDHNSVVGYMGSTGMSTGSHLHFEIKINGSTVDPNQIVKFY